MTMDTSQPWIAEIEKWLLVKSAASGRELESIDPDLDLIASGVVTSLSFVELTFLIGQLTGRTPDVRKLGADQFRTLRRIAESFPA